MLDAVLAELVVQQATIATEADAGLLSSLQSRFGDVPIDRTAHDELKASCARARAVVRTGDDTPFTNVILHAGVPFHGAGERP